jgi:hypothetical protein
MTVRPIGTGHLVYVTPKIGVATHNTRNASDLPIAANVVGDHGALGVSQVAPAGLREMNFCRTMKMSKRTPITILVHQLFSVPLKMMIC